MKRKKQLIVAIANTILGVLIFVVSFGVLMAGVMSGANAGNITGVLFASMSILFPAIPVISVIGAWIGYYRNSSRNIIVFAALPWGYFLILLLAFGII